MHLKRIPVSPPTIFPVPIEINRPMWSVMIPVYNCAHYLEEALSGVLKQDQGLNQMQIEVVDDASTDADVEALVQRIGKGRVSYFRQPENVGSVRNFETCLNRATGHYIHLLHGDDRVRPGYYTAMEQLFRQFPQAGAAFSQICYINSYGDPERYNKALATQPGILTGFMDLITQRQILQYAAISVKRSVYEELGGFYGVNYGEDWEMWARIGARYPVAYTPVMLADYREHHSNISAGKFRSGQHLLDLEKVFGQIVSYLPAAEQKRKGRELWRNYIRWTLGMTLDAWFNHHDRELVLHQIRVIRKLYLDREVISKMIHLRLLLWRMSHTVFYPYQVRNSDLASQLFIPRASDLANKGIYTVYWWKEIPMGQVYWQRGEDPKRTEPYKRILAALGPALEHYRSIQGMCADGKIKTGQLKNADPAELLEALANGSYREFLQELLGGTLVKPADMPFEVPVSVVICTRMRSIFLEKCLASLTSLYCRPQEIIVVHNGTDVPGDLTQQVVEQFKGVTYCREVRNGLDYARNAGGHLASCPVVAYIDDDVVLRPDWAFQVWQCFQDERVGAMTGLVIAAELLTASQQLFEQYWSFNRGYVEKVYDQQYFQTDNHGSPRVWNIGAGANMAFRKQVLESLNYFDERLDAGQAGCSGDSEIWFRVLAAGYQIKYHPRAVVYHYHRRHIQDLQNQLFNYMRGHVAAALIQHDQHPNKGYRRRVFLEFPKTYLNLLRAGFPRYTGRLVTLFREIRGSVSGIRFYYRHRNRPDVSYPQKNAHEPNR